MECHTHTSFEELFELGMQYYIAGRFMSLQMHIPVSANLLHHAVELFLKAHLADSMSIKVLKSRKYGHDLNKLWVEFCARYKVSDCYDKTISSLHRFEEIRYPDGRVTLSTLYALNSFPVDGPQPSKDTFYFSLEDVDSLVDMILSIDPSNKRKIEFCFGKVQMPQMSKLCIFEKNEFDYIKSALYQVQLEMCTACAGSCYARPLLGALAVKEWRYQWERLLKPINCLLMMEINIVCTVKSVVDLHYTQ